MMRDDVITRIAGSQSFTSRNKNKIVTIPLTLGEDGNGFNHTLKWVFYKNDYSNRYPADRAIFYSIDVEGIRVHKTKTD